MQIKADWQPTAEAINELPEPLRRYIHDLETLCDPAGMVRENWLLKQENEALKRKIEMREFLDRENLKPRFRNPYPLLISNPAPPDPTPQVDPYRLESHDESQSAD